MPPAEFMAVRYFWHNTISALQKYMTKTHLADYIMI